MGKSGSKYIVLDDGDFVDETIYESIEEAKDEVESFDAADAVVKSFVIYKLVPVMEYKRSTCWHQIEKKK